MQIKAIEQLIGGRQERTVKVDNITITIVPTDGYEPGKAPPRRQVAGIPRGWHFRINGGRWIQWRGEERSSLETTKAMAALFSLLYEYHLLGELGKPAT